jgi:hypothetical protein
MDINPVGLMEGPDFCKDFIISWQGKCVAVVLVFFVIMILRDMYRKR